MKRPFEIDFVKLYDMAQSKGEVDVLEHNILATYILHRNNFDFRTLLLSPRLKPSEKIEIISNLPGYKKSAVFNNLIVLLLELEKIDQLYYVQIGFSKIVSKKLNREMVQLFTAVPISDTFREEITTRLEKVLNRPVMVKTNVDPSLLGGTVVKLADGKIFNFSFSNALSDIKYLITEKN